MDEGADFVRTQFFDSDGEIAAGFKLHFYASGTMTAQDTWSDEARNWRNSNPVTLDSKGRASIFLDPKLSYRVMLAFPSDTDPPFRPIWRADGVMAITSQHGTKRGFGFFR